MKDLWQHLSETKKRILLYGTGNGADKILDQLISRGITVSGVFASDGFVRNRTFRGFKVISFSDAVDKFGDFIALVCFGTQLPCVMENIKKIAATVETYAPDVPVIDNDSIFDISFVREHKKELEKVYSLLADELSYKVFENTVMYKLTGKLEYLFSIESGKADTYKLLNITETEVYADLGAYTGDTIKEFIDNAGGYKKIIAAEPDIKNFRKLKQNTEMLKNISYHNVCISNKCGEMQFSMNSGRNSAVGKGNNFIGAVSIDALLQNTDVTFIKMDIEGQELNAISGGKNTLKKCKPKLNIAAYHKNEDLFSIPLLLNKINPDYKIYMRHHPYIPSWDTNFYVL